MSHSFSGAVDDDSAICQTSFSLTDTQPSFTVLKIFCMWCKHDKTCARFSLYIITGYWQHRCSDLLINTDTSVTFGWRFYCSFVLRGIYSRGFRLGRFRPIFALTTHAVGTQSTTFSAGDCLRRYTRQRRDTQRMSRTPVGRLMGRSVVRRSVRSTIHRSMAPGRRRRRWWKPMTLDGRLTDRET